MTNDHLAIKHMDVPDFNLIIFFRKVTALSKHIYYLTWERNVISIIAKCSRCQEKDKHKDEELLWSNRTITAVLGEASR